LPDNTGNVFPLTFPQTQNIPRAAHVNTAAVAFHTGLYSQDLPRTVTPLQLQ